MNTHAKKTIIGLSIAAALMTACSPTQQMTKPDADDEFGTSDAPAKAAKAKSNAVMTAPAITAAPAPMPAIPVMPAPAPMPAPVVAPAPVAATPPPPALKPFPQQQPQMQAATDCGRHQIDNNGQPEDAVKIRVTGYGAPPKAFYPDPQRRLMAMRAAKIDAYRSLAERVTGIQIWGGTTIGDMVVEKDRFRVYIDTFITGARVIAENPLDDGTFETIVELTVGQPFLVKTLPQRAPNNCAQHASTPVYQQNYSQTASANNMAKPNFY